VEVDDRIEAPGTQHSYERDFRPNAGAARRRHQHFVEMRVRTYDIGRGRFNQVGQMRFGNAFAEGVNRRSGENDVADFAKANQETRESSGFNRGFINQHDRNVVLDRVNPVAGHAFEGGAVLDERHRRFAGRTGENFEQFRVDSHAGNI
jgi:hypothetical protein